MKLFSSIQTRLVLSYLMVSLLSIVVIAAFAGSAINQAAYKDLENNLEDLAFASGNAVEVPLSEINSGTPDIERIQSTLERLLINHPNIAYSVFQTDGTPLLTNQASLPAKATPDNAPEVWAALQNDIGEGDHLRPNEQGQPTYYVAVRVQQGEAIFGVVRLSALLAPAMESAHRLLALLVLISLLVAAAVGIFGWLSANSISAPIKNLTQTAARIARGDLGARVEPEGPQELTRLADAFNIMAGRLQDHVDELRAFVANASHELRTPLTVVKLRTEALRDGAMEDPQVSGQFLAEIETEVDRLGRMVTDLLDLSRMEAGLGPDKRAMVNIGTIATDVYETFTIRANKAGVDFSLHLEPELPSMLGNEDQLRRVLYNFIDNAIKFTPQGGQVDFLVRTDQQGKTIRVLVKDSGPGIAAEDLPHIFERFYRVEATRPRYGTSRGSGLGLAIAKSIVENHDGKIGVSSQLGKGTTFWVELPTQPLS